MRARAGVIEQVVQMEHILASTKFAKSGSIYFREDIAGSDPLAVISPMDSTVLERFTIGPLVEHRLWRGERAVMDLNRGPCKSLLTRYSRSSSDNFQIMMRTSS